MKRVSLVLGVGFWLGVTVVWAQGIDAPIEVYRGAAAGGEVGVVKGRAFEERRRPTASDVPLTGTSIRLLPRSDALVVRLQGIKRGARDSIDAYRESASLVSKARELYEKRLLEAGAGDLPQAVTAGDDGAFALEGIPAGPWVLLASRSTYVSKTSSDKRGPAQTPTRPLPFLPPDKLKGYSVVTYWLREVTVVAGTVETVDLTDRNAWLTGITEDRDAAPGPPAPFQPRR
jgi:hypothetical protein